MDLYFYLSKILALFLSPINLLFILMLISFFIYVFFKKNFFKFIIFFSLVFIIFFSFFPIGSYLIKYLEKNYVQNKIINNVDAIVVLAGSENIINTSKLKKLDLHGSAERLIAFVELANKFKDSKLIYLGGRPYINNKNILSESEVAKIFFNNINFDTNRIIFLDSSRNTIENLQRLSDYNKNQNLKKILLITSAFHMNRSLLIANKLKLNLIPYAVDFQSDYGSNLENSWQLFSVSNNLKKVDLAFRELIGYFVTKIVL